MHLSTNYERFQLHGYWSKEVTALVEKMVNLPAKSYADQHDLALGFVNDALFEGEGAFNKEFRAKGKKYPDLKVPAKETEKGFEIVELKLRTSQLKYFRGELNEREEVFSTSDYLYFCYLLQVVPKEGGKPILERTCIYYLIIIILSKQTLTIPINELIEEIKMGTKHFTEKVAAKSGLDEEKEELLGVDNIIKVVDLERKLSEKDQIIDEKDKIIEEKDKEIERLKAQLKKK